MRRGFTILELLVAVVISLIILASVVGIYVVANRGFALNRELSLLKESTKEGIYALDWFFQRWGVGVPCINNADPANCARVQAGTDPNVYPPPSALFIVRRAGTPCDEVTFYGSLGGMAFVDSVLGTDRVSIMSCRLNAGAQQNCYHIWRGARVFTDFNNQNNPLIFTITNLSRDNLDCSRETQRTNATMGLVATARNGQLETWVGNTRVLTDRLNLEPGDLLVRVPHRIRIYCDVNPQDNNNLWIYVQTTDMSRDCNQNERPFPLVRVDRFTTQVADNGLLVDLTVREDLGGGRFRTLNIQRFYGR